MILTSNHRPHVNAAIFLDYMRTVFVSHLVGPRDLAEFAAEHRVSLTNDCSAHVTDDVIRLLTEARMRVITFAPHTTQISQGLDLKLVDVLKRLRRYELPFENGNATGFYSTRKS
jgi:hypothetical protein